MAIDLGDAEGEGLGDAFAGGGDELIGDDASVVGLEGCGEGGGVGVDIAVGVGAFKLYGGDGGGGEVADIELAVEEFGGMDHHCGYAAETYHCCVLEALYGFGAADDGLYEECAAVGHLDEGLAVGAEEAGTGDGGGLVGGDGVGGADGLIDLIAYIVLALDDGYGLGEEDFVPAFDEVIDFLGYGGVGEGALAYLDE